MERNWQHHRKSKIGSAVENLDMLGQIVVEIPHMSSPLAYYGSCEEMISRTENDFPCELEEIRAAYAMERKYYKEKGRHRPPSGMEIEVSEFCLAKEVISRDLSSLEILANKCELEKFLCRTTGHQIIKAQRAVLNLLG